MKQTTLVFLKRDNQLLLAMKKRGYGKGRWNGVGGKVEPDETVEAGMIRECEEEIAVQPTSYELVAELEFDQYFKQQHDFMRVTVYIATEWSGQPTESEEVKPAWFETNALPYDEMWPDDPYWLPLVLAGKKIQASFTMDQNDAILSHQIDEVSSF